MIWNQNGTIIIPFVIIKTIQNNFINHFICRLEPERRLLHTFENVLKLIQEDSFWNNVGEALENTYPKIIESLKNRMKDLQKHDCGIIVAGNVSGYFSKKDDFLYRSQNPSNY